MTTTVTRRATSPDIHIPYLSEDEKVFLNTTATYSQVRRMSTNTISDSHRPSMEENTVQNRRHQVVSVASLAFLWGGGKRRGSSSSTLTTSSSNGSIDLSINTAAANATMMVEEQQDMMHPQHPKSPKARELESLIFTQPQRTVRLSLTPRCAV